MLELTAIALFILWSLDFVSSLTLAGYINVALLLGAASVLFRVFRGRDIMS